MNPNDVTPLTEDERRRHAATLMAAELADTLPVARPVAVLTGGQPGSGKSYIVGSVGVEFEGLGGIVKIDPDEIRPTLPYMGERIAKGDLEIPDAAYADAGTIAYQMLQLAKQERRNVVVDGTLQNTDRALGLAEEMRKAGYEVQFRGMAVHPDLSHARTYTRREEQIAASPSGFGRGVGDDFHDQAVKGYTDTVEAFQTRSAVDSMTFYGEGGKTVETKLVDGQWTPALSMREELDRIQKQPEQRAMMAASDAWWTASHMMRGRHADPDEIQKIDGYRQFAALRERQLRPTSVSASVTFPSTMLTTPTRSVASTGIPPASNHDQGAVDGRPDLSDPRMLAIAKLVHEGIRQAGKDPDDSMMMVTWTPEETYLDIKTPTDKGRFERFTLPGHQRVEQALRGVGAQGTLDVDFADASANPVRTPGADLGALASTLGIDPADMGIRAEKAPGAQIGTDREPVRRAAGMTAMAAMVDRSR